MNVIGYYYGVLFTTSNLICVNYAYVYSMIVLVVRAGEIGF